jgi:hypothetical protein
MKKFLLRALFFVKIAGEEEKQALIIDLCQKLENVSFATSQKRKP